MIQISHYQTTEQLYESPNSRVYRAREHLGERPVILKVLNDCKPSLSALGGFGGSMR